MDYNKLADLLLPAVKESPVQVTERYPERNLAANAKVTRIAPSPTGFIHLGVVYAALISERLAHQSDGVFFLRIEDTDKKREVEGSIPEIIKALDYFGIHFDEGDVQAEGEVGNYGPYKQSERKSIYEVFAKALIREGLAYPCFCSVDETNAIREQQMAANEFTGYYGKWTRCRELSVDAIQARIAAGLPFVLRLKSHGKNENKVTYTDLLKGEITLPENFQDIVLLKQDGLPTYHFAHAVDDHLMGTTHVFRGDEWLASIPIHLQLFQILGWTAPHYGHISPIMKIEGNSKRKFSKRKDPEFAVHWYREQGYPGDAIVEYLLGLVNSNFQEWRVENARAPLNSFKITVDKMGSSGALFDMDKMNDVSKNAIASFSAERVYQLITEWASQYDQEFAELIAKYKDYTMAILSLDRDSHKPRKDFTNWSEVRPAIGYFYDELYDAQKPDGPDFEVIVKAYIASFDERDEKTLWFEKLRVICDSLGYARDVKSYKQAPTSYKGHVGDVAMLLRIALTGRTHTPDLYEITRIMGTERVVTRLKKHIGG